MKNFCIIGLVVYLLIQVSSSYNSYEDNDSTNYPKNDFVNFINAFWKKIGVEKMLKDLGKYLNKKVRSAQSYTSYDFHRDFEKVKKYPTFWNIIEFIKRATWPSIVHSCTQIINFVHNIQRYLLKFLEKKCDEHMGRGAPFHPWTILKQKDNVQVSFLIFVYAVAISLVMIRILSWWNFSVYLAFGFLIYYLGGPQSLFKALLTVTGLIWFIIDVVIQNPLQVAVTILILYFLRLAKNLVPSSSSSASVNPIYTPRLNQENIPDRREYNTLANRVNSMEEKTDLLNSKLDRLTRLLDRQIDE